MTWRFGHSLKLARLGPRCRAERRGTRERVQEHEEAALEKSQINNNEIGLLEPLVVGIIHISGIHLFAAPFEPRYVQKACTTFAACSLPAPSLASSQFIAASIPIGRSSRRIRQFVRRLEIATSGQCVAIVEVGSTEGAMEPHF